MKRCMLVLGLLALGAVLFAQVNLPEYRFASGNWRIANARLYQNNAASGLAKINIRVPQSGTMLYEFDARYEGGAEDGHGGFGLHVFEDIPLHRASWGAGLSYLLWLNYDENPVSNEIPRGLSGQVYRSYTNSRMELAQSYDLNEYAPLLTEDNLSWPVHFKIIVDGAAGEVQIYDPTDEERIFTLYLDTAALPLRGNWVSLRTNGMKMSFTN